MSNKISGVGLLRLNTGDLLTGDDCTEFYIAIHDGQLCHETFPSYAQAVDHYLDIVSGDKHVERV